MILNEQKGPLCYACGVPFLKFTPSNFSKSIQTELIDKAHFLIDKNRYKNISNVGGFHSQAIMKLDWESFDAGKWFTSSIDKALVQSMRLLHNSHNPDIALKITNSWYTVHKAKESNWNMPHTHPGSYISGAFYLSSQSNTKGTGKFIAIIDNNIIRSIRPEKEGVKLIEYIPIEGELILFPSSVVHMVSPHTANYDRIMISFNTNKVTTEKQENDTLS